MTNLISKDINQMIDYLGPCQFLKAVADICKNRADYAVHQWYDVPLAKQWIGIATDLINTADKAEGLYIPTGTK